MEASSYESAFLRNIFIQANNNKECISRNTLFFFFLEGNIVYFPFCNRGLLMCLHSFEEWQKEKVLCQLCSRISHALISLEFENVFSFYLFIFFDRGEK